MSSPLAYVPSDREPLPSGLIPAERVALTVARAQLERGDTVTANIAAVLVMTVDRLTGGRGRAIQINEPRPYAMIRDELLEAISRVAMDNAGDLGYGEFLADALLKALDDISDERRPAS
jgi:hypothetical protein